MSTNSQAALTLANTIRLRRVEERRLTSRMSHTQGQARLADLLDLTPEWLASEPLGRLLSWPAHAGRSTTASTLALASALAGRYISSEERADELRSDEKDILVAILRGERVRPLVHVCAACGMEKSYQAFGRHGKAGGGWRDHRGVHRRSYCRECQRLRDQDRYATARGRPRGETVLGPDVMLPVEPFAQWLERKLARYKLEHNAGEDAFADSLCLGRRQLRVYLRREQKTVTSRVVDCVLTHEGSTWLGELYPSLYPEGEVAA